MNGQLTLQVKEMMDSTGFKEKLPQLPYVADNVYVAVVNDPSKMIDGNLAVDSITHCGIHRQTLRKKQKSLRPTLTCLKQKMRISLQLEVERMRLKTSTDLWEVYSL